MAEQTTGTKPESIPFYPDHVRTEAWVSFGVLGLLLIVGIIGTLAPVGVGAPADPFNTPAHTKPEWYFLFLYQILKFVPKTIGVLLPIIGLLMVVIWPFLDRKEDSVQARRVRWIITIVTLVVITGLTIWGEVS